MQKTKTEKEPDLEMPKQDFWDSSHECFKLQPVLFNFKAFVGKTYKTIFFEIFGDSVDLRLIRETPCFC